MFRTPVRDGFHLALLTLRDAPALHAHLEANREHLRQWLDEPDELDSLSACRAWLEQCAEAFAAGRAQAFGLWEGRTLAGLVGLHEITPATGIANIGYWIGQPWEGQGLITESVRLLLACCFTDLGLTKAEILCPVENARSRSIPERLGFTLEGVRRQGAVLRGWPLDVALYGLLIGEWRQAAGGVQSEVRT